jgi:FdhD protein
MTIESPEEGLVQVAARVDGSHGNVSAADARMLAIPSAEVFNRLFRDLFSAVESRHESGGMHAAAATDGTKIVKQVEDVGRHNTIDKIVGMLLLSGLSFGHHGLLTSSRVSGEIAHKTGRAGCAWLASRSIPTTLAVRFAQQSGLPIIGRAASRSAHVY